MTEPTTAGRFHAAEGVQDWRMLYDGAHAHFRTASYADGLALVAAIGAVAAGQAPGIDLRAGSVSVRLAEADVELARRISAAAHELGATADPGAVQVVEIAVQALAVAEVQPFWRAALGYTERSPRYLVDGLGRCASLVLQRMDEPRPQRLHVDISVPHDQAEARVASALAAGGRLVTDRWAPAWWVLADADGNEACVATWQGRE